MGREAKAPGINEEVREGNPSLTRSIHDVALAHKPSNGPEAHIPPVHCVVDHAIRDGIKVEKISRNWCTEEFGQLGEFNR
jgi:hypothetical protein